MIAITMATLTVSMVALATQAKRDRVFVGAASPTWTVTGTARWIARTSVPTTWARWNGVFVGVAHRMWTAMAMELPTAKILVKTTRTRPNLACADVVPWTLILTETVH
jgi:hypothetical protein